MNYNDFITMVTPGALQGYQDYGILPSVTIAQAMLESSQNGVPANSEIYKQTNNLFGIKGSGTKGTYSTQSGNYRVYNTPEESILDHNKILGTQSNFKNVTSAKDFKTATAALQSGGYAEDKQYSNKLNSLIQSNGLYQLDQQVQNPKTVIVNGQKFTVTPSIVAPTSGMNNQSTVPSAIQMPSNTTDPQSSGGLFSGLSSIINKILFIVAGIVIGYLALKYLLGSEN